MTGSVTEPDDEEVGTPFPIRDIPEGQLDQFTQHAHYDEDDGKWFGEIAGLEGLCAHGKSQAEAMNDLRCATRVDIPGGLAGWGVAYSKRSWGHDD